MMKSSLLLLNLLALGLCFSKMQPAGQVKAQPYKRTAAQPYEALLSLKKDSILSNQDLQKILADKKVLSAKSIFSESEQTYLRSSGASHLANAWVVQYKSESDFKSAQADLNSAFRLESNDMGIQLTMDAYESLQWGLHNDGTQQNLDLDAVKSYRLPAIPGEDIQMKNTAGPRQTIVAVLDTGVDHNHPDLKNILVRNESECRALEKFLKCTEDEDRTACEKKWMSGNNPEVDQDKNGYPMDCSGWSLLGGKTPTNIMGRPDFDDEQGHGSHVAGIVAAEAGNGTGVRGVSSRVKILSVQVIGVAPSEPLKPQSVKAKTVGDLKLGNHFEPSETGDKVKANRSLGDLVARGVIYAVRSGAKVINFSLGWPQAKDSEYMRSIIAEAQKKGVIIVAAAGNDSTRALLRPCAYDGVICVGAQGPDGSLAHFSNFGSGVDIAAPGINILSTYPESLQASRFRDSQGYEYLSGTSQASPFVAGIVGDLLSQGVSASEIYPRLIVGARAVKKNMSLIEGLPHQTGVQLAADDRLEKKYILSGLVDVQKSLKASAEAVILPVSKEVHGINWDRKSSTLVAQFQLKNFWKDIASSSVQIKAGFDKPAADAVRPQIQSVSVSGAGVWKMGEIRNVTVRMALADASKASRSQIPSELNLAVMISTPQSQRKVVIENEVIVEINPNTNWDDVQRLNITGLTSANDDRTEFVPVDDNWDLHPEKRDYLVIKTDALNPKKWEISLLNESGSSYQATGSAKISVSGEAEKIRTQVTTRFSENGQTRYAVGVLTDNSEDDEPKPSPTSFYIFDDKMKLVDSYTYTAEKAVMPFQIFWMSVDGQKHPAWVGFGKDPSKVPSLRDKWEKTLDNEKSELRFYYLDESKQLKALSKYNDFKIVDVIEPTQAQKEKGIIRLLLAKNRGTEAKPSYLSDFAEAEITEGQIQNFKVLNISGEGKSYRNLLDTRVDKVLNLTPSQETFRGTFWFSEGALRQQRLSVYDPVSGQFLDQELKALNKLYDSALWVRSAYLGNHEAGAFVLTNSEIQYHDLKSGQIASRSFERYTFFPDRFMTNAYFPLTIAESGKAHRAALFTTESSGLSRGVKMVVPVFAKDGKVIELVSPARLRIKSNAGCRPLNTPVFRGVEGYAFDYYCGDRILRVPLAL